MLGILRRCISYSARAGKLPNSAMRIRVPEPKAIALPLSKTVSHASELVRLCVARAGSLVSRLSRG